MRTIIMRSTNEQQQAYTQTERYKALRFDAFRQGWLFQEGQRLLKAYHVRMRIRLILRVTRFVRYLRAWQLRQHRRASRRMAPMLETARDWLDQLHGVVAGAPTFTHAMVKAAQPHPELAHLPHATATWHKRCVLHVHTLIRQGYDLRSADAIRLLQDNLLYDLHWNLRHGHMPHALYETEKQQTLRYLQTVLQSSLRLQPTASEPASVELPVPQLTPSQRVIAQSQQTRVQATPAIQAAVQMQPVMAKALQDEIAVMADFRAVRRCCPPSIAGGYAPSADVRLQPPMAQSPPQPSLNRQYPPLSGAISPSSPPHTLGHGPLNTPANPLSTVSGNTPLNTPLHVSSNAPSNIPSTVPVLSPAFRSAESLQPAATSAQPVPAAALIVQRAQPAMSTVMNHASQRTPNKPDAVSPLSRFGLYARPQQRPASSPRSRSSASANQPSRQRTH
jgi:hypothetical protein